MSSAILMRRRLSTRSFRFRLREGIINPWFCSALTSAFGRNTQARCDILARVG
jgi:hypothetical protein